MDEKVRLRSYVVVVRGAGAAPRRGDESLTIRSRGQTYNQQVSIKQSRAVKPRATFIGRTGPVQTIYQEILPLVEGD